MLMDYKQLRREGLMPYSREHLRRLIEAGKFRKPIQLGGPKGKRFWDDEQLKEDFANAARESDAA